MLINANGHLKLTDFGLSKMNFTSETQMTHTFCGSPEYMAPEMLKQLGHGRALDFYQLGALLYEMLTGLPPFYSDNRIKMYQDIVSEEKEAPRNGMSREAEALVRRLLERDPKKRIVKVEEIKRQPFC